jgi:tellurite resistance protein
MKVSLPVAQAMVQPSQPLPSADLALLRILCCVAWSDGEVSSEEKALLHGLAQGALLPQQDQVAASDALEVWTAEAVRPEALDALLPLLGSEDERQLAVKLAYQVITISRLSGDTSPVNAAEKVAYRRLVDAVGLTPTQVQEAEWAAQQEMGSHSSLLALLASRFRSLGAWPADDLLEQPGAPRL